MMKGCEYISLDSTSIRLLDVVSRMTVGGRGVGRGTFIRDRGEESGADNPGCSC